MYQPYKYKNNDPSFIYNFIQQHPFATVVLQGNHLLATHIPVLVEGTPENYRLYAHIANHNPMREFLVDNQEMLLIFKGPDAYISSTWYSIPEVPTWDYTAVHINAKLQLQSDAELQTALEKLIDYFEKDLENPLSSKAVPQQIWDDNFKGITGFWLEPFRAVGIEKLHQGFKKEDVKNIVEQLKSDSGCPMEHQLGNLLDKKHNPS